jgi:hypothetical protein
MLSIQGLHAVAQFSMSRHIQVIRAQAVYELQPVLLIFIYNKNAWHRFPLCESQICFFQKTT